MTGDEGDVKEKPRAYDLEQRTSRFGRDVIRFAGHIPKSTVTVPLISQLVRAATSVGANYCEADEAVSRKDFKHKLSICRKEAHEVKHWLRMVVEAAPGLRSEARPLAQEAKELSLIFNASIRTASSKGDK
jgi:four helix bundle protein